MRNAQMRRVQQKNKIVISFAFAYTIYMILSSPQRENSLLRDGRSDEKMRLYQVLHNDDVDYERTLERKFRVLPVVVVVDERVAPLLVEPGHVEHSPRPFA